MEAGLGKRESQSWQDAERNVTVQRGRAPSRKGRSCGGAGRGVLKVLHESIGQAVAGRTNAVRFESICSGWIYADITGSNCSSAVI